MNTGACGDSNCTFYHDVHTCDFCNVVCTSAATYSSHLRGKKHRKNLRVAELRASQPELTADDNEAPPGFRLCDLCDAIIPEETWVRHMNGVRHRNKERFFAFKSVTQEAERDKHGVTVSHQDGIDFGIIELRDAQRGAEVTLTLKTTVPSSHISVLETNLFSASSRGYRHGAA